MSARKTERLGEAATGIASTLREYVTGSDRLISVYSKRPNISEAEKFGHSTAHANAGEALERAWAQLDTLGRSPASLPVVASWLRTYKELRIVGWLKDRLNVLAASAKTVVDSAATIEDRVKSNSILGAFTHGPLVLLDTAPQLVIFLLTHGNRTQKEDAMKLADQLFAPSFIASAASAVSAVRKYAQFAVAPDNLAALGVSCGHGTGCDCMSKPTAYNASLAALAGCKFLRFCSQHLHSRTDDIRRGEPSSGQPAAPLLVAICDGGLAGAAAGAVVDAPDLRERDVRSRLAFNLHHVAKDAAQALVHLQCSLDSLEAAAAAAGSRSGGGARASGAPPAQELMAHAQALARGLADPDVVRLQEAMLERLFVHAGLGDGGSLWLARMEASRGLLALCDPRVVADDTPSEAPWLEDDHCNVLFASLGVWRAAAVGPAAAAAAGPAPACVAALTVHAGEALCRLSTGTGLGGRGYTPGPQWQFAKTKPLMSIFDMQPLARRLSPAQARSVGVDMLEAAAWGLALASLALAAEARGEGGVTAAQRPGPPRSQLELEADPKNRWWGATQMMPCLIQMMAVCDVNNMDAASRAKVSERLWRAGAAATFDRLLRLTAAAELRGASRTNGPAGVILPPSMIFKCLLAPLSGRLLPMLAPPPPPPAAAAGSGDNNGAAAAAESTGMGVLVSAAKYSSTLVRQYDARRQALDGAGGGGGGSAAAVAARDLVTRGGPVLDVLMLGVRAYRRTLQDRLEGRGLEALPTARTAEAIAEVAPPAATAAVAAALRATCVLALRVTQAAAAAAEPPGPAGAAAAELYAERALVESLGDCLGEWARAGLYPLFLPAPQLLACQPHRLVAAACELLAASAAAPPIGARKELAYGLLEALAAAAAHETLSGHAYDWLRGTGGGGGGGGDAQPLGGCLAARLRSALPAMVRLAPPQAGCALALLRLAASEARPPRPGAPLDPVEGVGAFRGVALDMANHLIGASSAEEAAAVVGVRLPPDGRLVAAVVGDAMQAAAEARSRPPPAAAAARAALQAAAELPPVPVAPADVAQRQLRVCGNPSCEVFDGDSEAGLQLKQCSGCRGARYCGAACQRAHWTTGGHKGECKLMAAAATAKAGGGGGGQAG